MLADSDATWAALMKADVIFVLLILCTSVEACPVMPAYLWCAMDKKTLFVIVRGITDFAWKPSSCMLCILLFHVCLLFLICWLVLDLCTTLLEASSHCFYSNHSVFIWQAMIELQTSLIHNYWQIRLLTDSSPLFWKKIGTVCSGLYIPCFHKYFDNRSHVWASHT